MQVMNAFNEMSRLVLSSIQQILVVISFVTRN